MFNTINEERKFVFFHVPKNAGCSIKDILIKYQPEAKTFYKSYSGDNSHPKYRVIINKAPHIEDYFKFSITRNPWDRFVSAFLFLKRGGLGDQFPNDLKYKKMIEVFGGDIKTFLRSGFDFKKHIKHMKPQHLFLCDKHGKVKMDYVGEYNSLQEDFDKICDKIGIERAALPHANKTHSKTKHYSQYYNEETKQIIAKAYKKDIDLFEYDF